MKLAKNIGQLKAVSQNLMHANLSTTDGIYGILSDTDIREQMGSLGNSINRHTGVELEDLENLAKSILADIERRRK